MTPAVRARPSRLPHLHNFRGLAIIFIVATHCVSVFDWSDSPVLRDVLGRVFANGTIFFLFIAGYLFHYLSPGFRTVPYWKKKALNVVLPYCIVSVPAIILSMTLMKREGLDPSFYQQPKWQQVLEFLVTGSHMAPFWYIPTIIIFYAVAPILLRIFSSDRAYWLLIPIFVVGLSVSRGENNPILAFVHFLSIWVLGMSCSNFRERADDLLNRWFWLLPVAVIALFLIAFYTTPGTHTWYSDLQKAFLSLFFYTLFNRLGTRADRWFALIGSLSFGLFFLHSYVISTGKIMLEFVVGYQPAGGILSLTIAAIAAVGLTMLAVQAVKRLAGKRSRYLIGV